MKHPWAWRPVGAKRKPVKSSESKREFLRRQARDQKARGQQ